MYVLVGVISFVAGCAFGITIMCLVQINRVNGNARFENDLNENGGK